MQRTRWIKMGAVAFLAAAGTAGAVQAKSLEGTRPNIIFVMSDDQGSNLSCMGHPILQTPNIDQFAEQSLRFREYHVSPTCAPTRSALLSGRHEFKNGVTHTVNERELMALSTTTFPQLLQRAGYTTGIFGKWHLGDEEAYLPSHRGFDEAFTHGAGGIGQKYSGSCADFPPNREKAGLYFDNVLLQNETIVQTQGYCADVFFQAALGWIKKNHEADQPFFAYISSNTPHAPCIAPEASLQRIADRYPGSKVKGIGRYAMIENLDDNFGLLMRKLKEWDALNNTLIIFTTDNGAPHKPGSTEFNAGFKTGKGSVYEGGVHVPMFWYWKDVLPQDQDLNALTAHIDLFKTFCDLAGATIPSDIQQIEGRSLLPLLENPDAKWEERLLFSHRGRWNKGATPDRDHNWAVRTSRWRLVGAELYDMSNDPFEANDVAAQYPEVVGRLRQAYFQWWDETVPFMINEDRECEVEDPLGKRYYKQKAEQGIPDWVPPTI